MERRLAATIGAAVGIAAEFGEGTPSQGMAGQHTNPNVAALRRLEASVHRDLLERDVSVRPPHHSQTHPTLADLGLTCWRLSLLRTWVRWRRMVLTATVLAGVMIAGLLALWWRLGSGPIDFDIATPWLAAAIEENFGNHHRIAVGGAQIERDANGYTALRIRDIVVRDEHGEIVASAPKAEVSVSGSGLFTGRVRAERLSLIGAEMQVRIEADSRVTVFAGSNRQPFVTASASESPLRAGLVNAAAQQASENSPSSAAGGMVPDLGALLAWIDRIGATGLDGHELAELGLKNGNLVVDDQRSGKQWTFHDINLSLTRPAGGGIALTMGSEAGDRPWLLRATVTRGEAGIRKVDLDIDRLPAKDLLLALRIGNGQYEPNMPVSARIRASIGADGVPQMVEGRVQLDSGFVVDPEEPLSRIEIDRAEFNLTWNAVQKTLVIPFQVVSGANRLTLLAHLNPSSSGSVWTLKIAGGSVVLASARHDPDSVVINRIHVGLRIDLDKQRIDVEQGDIGNADVGIAVSGALDYSSGEPRLAVGVAGTRMSVAAMKRLWPSFISPKVHAWVSEHILSGTVERVLIATNAPIATLKTVGPPIPDDGLVIEISGNGAEVQPIAGLPPIRDADMAVRITGRTAKVSIGRGNVEDSQGRRLSISNGVFEVPDHYMQTPQSRVHFRLDGSVAAAAELLSSERLRDYAGSPIDPNSSRGTLTAHVTMSLPLKPDLPPGSTQYSMNLEIANFAAERLVMGKKVEAAKLQARADNQGYVLRGDVKIAGIPAMLEYRRQRDSSELEVRLATTLDESARSRLGLDLGGSISGPVPIRVNGRVPVADGDGRYSVEADLGQARIDRLLPGWVKPPGRAARMSFFMTTKQDSINFDDLTIEGPGMLVKGTLETDTSGNVQSANLPNFNLTDGDKAVLRAERGPDGALRVTVRGDVYDGRNFIKSSMSGSASGQSDMSKIKDMDVDVRLGTVAGFHGETMRNVELRMSRRNGAITSFSLAARLGRDTPLTGDLRGRSGGRNTIYIETRDAGALFRFSDIYPKIHGGEMWMAMDPPNDNGAPQNGILNIRDFHVRGEAALDRVANGSAEMPGSSNSSNPGVEFSRMRVDFSRSHGRFAIREGIVRGPLVGATTEGYIDYLREEVRMRGTFVPFFGLNNMFGQIPVFGLFLGGGSNEGLVGLTFEVVGPPSAPTLRVNPISVVVPGLFRKIFEFPNGGFTGSTSTPQSFADPSPR
jgi:hypothetical protein